MNRVRLSRSVKIGLSALCIGAVTLFFVWHTAIIFIQRADGWDLNSIAQTLQHPLPTDASDITYTGARRGQLVWLHLEFVAPFDSLNSFAASVCDQSLQPAFDPSNAIYLSTSYSTLNPTRVLMSNRNVFAYSPLSRADVFGTTCEIAGGYVRMMVNRADLPRFILEFSSVCFYPCRLNQLDYEAINDAPFVFRGFAPSTSENLTVIGRTCVELHPRIAHMNDVSYIDARLAITLNDVEIATAIVTELFQLEPLVDSQTSVTNTNFFDVCFTPNGVTGEHQVNLVLAKTNGDTASYSLTVSY